MIPKDERRYEPRISEDGQKLWQCHICGEESEWDENFWYLDEGDEVRLIACSEACKEGAEKYLQEKGETEGGDKEPVIAALPKGVDRGPVKRGHGLWVPLEKGEGFSISFEPFSFDRKYTKTEDGKYMVEKTGKNFARQYLARRHLLKTLEADLLKTLVAVRRAMEE